LDIDIEIQNTDLNDINDLSREDALSIQLDQMAREQVEVLQTSAALRFPERESATVNRSTSGNEAIQPATRSRA